MLFFFREIDHVSLEVNRQAREIDHVSLEVNRQARTTNWHFLVQLEFEKKFEIVRSTRKHCSRMRTAGFPDRSYQMSVPVEGGPCTVRSNASWVNGHMGTRSPAPTPCEQTDTTENITFPQLRRRAVTSNINFNSMYRQI